MRRWSSLLDDSIWCDDRYDNSIRFLMCLNSSREIQTYLILLCMVYNALWLQSFYFLLCTLLVCPLLFSFADDRWLTTTTSIKTRQWLWCNETWNVSYTVCGESTVLLTVPHTHLHIHTVYDLSRISSINHRPVLSFGRTVVPVPVPVGGATTHVLSCIFDTLLLLILVVVVVDEMTHDTDLSCQTIIVVINYSIRWPIILRWFRGDTSVIPVYRTWMGRQQFRQQQQQQEKQQRMP